MRFHKSCLVLENRFDKLVNQIFRKIISTNRKIVKSDGMKIICQRGISPGRYRPLAPQTSNPFLTPLDQAE